MLVETVVAVLALGRLQAIYTPIFSGLRRAGDRHAARRLRGVVLITADGFLRRGVVGAAEGGRRRGGRRRAVGPARAWSCGARARRIETPWTHGRDAWWDEAGRRRGGRAAIGGEVDPETPYMLIYTSGTTGRPKGAVHVHGGFPIKGAQDLAHQFDLGPRRHAVLVHRPRLDDGSVGDLRVAAARRAARALRGRARLPGPGPAVVARRAPPRHPPGPLPHRHPRADGPRRGAGPRARPLVAARPRLDRRAVEPRPVVVVLPRGRRGPLPDRQLLGRDRGLGRDRVRQRARADQAGVVLRAVHRDRGGRRGRGRRVGPRRGRRARHPRADARHDPRLLARPASATRRRTGRASPARGSTATGRASTTTASGTSTAAPTTRSRSPASASGRPRSRARPCPIRRSWRRPRSACRTRSRARWSSCSCVLRPGRDRRRRTLRASIGATVAAQLGKPLKPERRGRRPGAAQDALRQGHAPRGPGGLAGPRPGRPVGARRSADARGDPEGRIADAVTTGPMTRAFGRR